MANESLICVAQNHDIDNYGTKPFNERIEENIVDLILQTYIYLLKEGFDEILEDILCNYWHGRFCRGNTNILFCIISFDWIVNKIRFI